MDIQIKYGGQTFLNDNEINELLEFSKKFGSVKLSKWGHRSGAIDIVTFLELTISSAIFQSLTKPIIEGYLKGLANESYFKDKGEQHRVAIKNEILGIKNYLNAFYQVFVRKYQYTDKSIAIVETIDNCTIYVVLNNEKVTEKLVDNLADALVKTCSYVALKLIDVSEPYVIQLYPNFSTQTWDYLFIPTIQGFGKYIDRYYDFKNNQFYEINSAEEFIEKFSVDDMDDYKFIVSAKYHLDN
jgi:hypothetical protein